MKGILKDLVVALLLGMVLPGIVLNGAVLALERMEAVLPEVAAEEIQLETPEQAVAVNIRLRGPDGTW